ncbi:MAG: antitoxin, RHH family protein [Nitrospirae bacterium]|nr:antitoxin, RHH family protein [Nitrospirota bacterium]
MLHYIQRSKEVKIMPAKNPRINIVVERPLYTAIHDMAEDSGISMAMVVRDLIKEALELKEDAALAAFADERMKSFNRKKALSHDEVWG